MKRFIILILCLGLLIMVAGCGAPKKPIDSSATTADVTENLTLSSDQTTTEPSVSVSTKNTSNLKSGKQTTRTTSSTKKSSSTAFVPTTQKNLPIWTGIVTQAPGPTKYSFSSLSEYFKMAKNLWKDKYAGYALYPALAEGKDKEVRGSYYSAASVEFAFNYASAKLGIAEGAVKMFISQQDISLETLAAMYNKKSKDACTIKTIAGQKYLVMKKNGVLLETLFDGGRISFGNYKTLTDAQIEALVPLLTISKKKV